MSYCVNCGVELDDSAKKCALCQTEVLNPNIKKREEVETPFSEEAHIPKTVKTRFIALLISMILLIPSIVCFLIDFIFFPEVSWSPYVVCSLLLVWVIFVFPFFIKTLRPYIMWGFDTAAVSVYVYLFLKIYSDGIAWYTRAALPMILLNSVFVLIYIIWVRKRKRHWLLKWLHIFADIGISSLISGFFLSHGLGFEHALSIGMIVCICLLSLVAFLIYCYSSKVIRKWLSKKFFT